MELLWSLAPHCPRVVLEANFRTQSEYERGKVEGLIAGGTEVVEVYCRVSRDEASRRFAERARGERLHPAHALAEMAPERMAEYEEPFALGPVIEVDTARPVDVEGLVEKVERAWKAEEV
jgi:hypothetical protein